MKTPKRKASKHPMFKRWCLIRTWTRNATPTKYSSYYGVTICPEWDTFWNFADYIDEHWDVSGITPDNIFDRIDNTKPYQPGNVRFTDRKGNCRDRKSSHYLTYKRQTRSLAEWSELTGIEYSCLLSRVYAGNSPKDCLGY